MMTGGPSVNHAPHVLLIGEDPKQNEVHADLIREVNPDCHLDVVSRPESSVDWLERASYQLVVIDMKGSALEVIEKIKRLSPTTGVVVLSEDATIDEAVAAIRLGAEDYIKKPFSIDKFQLAVKRGLDRKTIFGESAGASEYLNLVHSCQMISASLQQAKIFSIIKSYFSRELRAPHSAIYRIRGGAPMRVDEKPDDPRRDRALEEVLDISLHAANPLPALKESGEGYRFIERSQLTPGLFVFRFRCVGVVDYFCVCLSPEQPASKDAFENRLRMLRAQIEVTGKNIEQYMGVQSLAFVDDATGLYNTRYLNHILDREIAQAKAAGRSFAVLFIDADHFKGVNDKHGHLSGTKLLNELGAHLKSYVRDSDTVFRYGGDEFVAVLSPCDLQTAQGVAERIRHSVETHTFIAADGQELRITVSIGVALFPDHADSKKAIIDAADQAMYTAKRATRNMVFIFGTTRSRDSHA